mgnify:CR=1 FL=1
MKYFDLVDFDISLLRFPPSFYGFEKIFTTKDIKITSDPMNKEAKILTGPNDLLLKNYRKFDILYSKTYEYSLELFAKAKEQNKPFLLSISDIFSNPLNIYRIRNFIKVARHYDIKLIVVSLAKNEFMIRSTEESAFILSHCGMNKDQVRYSYSLLQRLL